MISTTHALTVTGKAQNVNTMVLSIKSDAGVTIANLNATVDANTWAIPVGGLQNGSYTLKLYNVVNGYDLTNAQVLSTATLTVNAN